MTSGQYKILQFSIAQTKGGMTQYVLNNWNHIDRERFVFDFVTFSPHLDFEDDLLKEGSKVFHFSCYYRDNPDQFVREIDDILQQGYDAIHLHTNYWENAIAEERSRKAGIPKIIIHSHSTGVSQAQDKEESNQKTMRHYEVRDQIDFDLATDYCACSLEAAKWLFGNRIPKDKIHILHNGVDTEKFRFRTETRQRVRAELGINDETLLISVIGRLVYAKNQEFLIRILPKLQKKVDVKLLIVGDGPQREELSDMANSMGMNKRVLFLGFRSDIPNLLHATDVYCMPSRFEGLPIALIEAQCSGVPCVVSDRISPEAIITNRVKIAKLTDEQWIDEILHFSGETTDREEFSNIVKRKGFDICDQVSLLERLYAGQ